MSKFFKWSMGILGLIIFGSLGASMFLGSTAEGSQPQTPSPVVATPAAPAPAPAAQPTGGIQSEKAKELAATMLNLNGLLCASVVEIHPLKVDPNVHEVTCVEYRGGSRQKTYHLNTNTGKAWPA